MLAAWGPHGSGRRVEAFFRQREIRGNRGWNFLTMLGGGTRNNGWVHVSTATASYVCFSCGVGGVCSPWNWIDLSFLDNP